MSTNRVDTVEKYFKPLELANKISNIFLSLSIIIPVVLLNTGNSSELKSVLNVLFITSTCIYFLVSNVSSLYLARRAQNKRMTHLLSNSFGVLLDDEETNLYYNNTQIPSITRLGINVFENSLFSKKVASKMIIRERWIIFILLMLSVVLIINRSTSLELLSIIAQTLLTTTILTNWIKLELLNRGFENVYETCRKLFLSPVANNNLYTSQILEVVMEYEVLKASMGINLSSSIFKKINLETTAEWERIKTRLGL